MDFNLRCAAGQHPALRPHDGWAQAARTDGSQPAMLHCRVLAKSRYKAGLDRPVLDDKQISGAVATHMHQINAQQQLGLAKDGITGCVQEVHWRAGPDADTILAMGR